VEGGAGSPFLKGARGILIFIFSSKEEVTIKNPLMQRFLNEDVGDCNSQKNQLLIIPL